MFAVRENEVWLSWEETKFYAALLDLPTVPELSITKSPAGKTQFEAAVLQLASGSGHYDPVDAETGKPATMEGVVSRNADRYPTEEFSNNVFKYVRKGHVKTGEHWTRYWKRAPLIQEGGNYVATV